MLCLIKKSHSRGWVVSTRACSQKNSFTWGSIGPILPWIDDCLPLEDGCLPYSVGKQPFIPMINFGENGRDDDFYFKSWKFIWQIIVPMPSFDSQTKKPLAKTPKEKEKVLNASIINWLYSEKACLCVLSELNRCTVCTSLTKLGKYKVGV